MRAFSPASQGNGRFLILTARVHPQPHPVFLSVFSSFLGLFVPLPSCPIFSLFDSHTHPTTPESPVKKHSCPQAWGRRKSLPTLHRYIFFFFYVYLLHFFCLLLFPLPPIHTLNTKGNRKEKSSLLRRVALCCCCCGGGYYCCRCWVSMYNNIQVFVVVVGRSNRTENI